MSNPTPPIPPGPGGSDPAPPARTTWRMRLGRWWPAVVGAGVILALLNDGTALVGQAAHSVQRAFEGSSTPAHTDPPPPAESTNPPVGITGAADTSEVHVGDCLADDGGLVSCQVGHRQEVIGTGTDAQDCTTSHLTRYLGGRPDVDVLNDRISAVAAATDGAPLCLAVVAAPAVEGSAADTLGLRRIGDVWRRCHDATTDAEVACSVPHTGEFVSWADNGAGSSSALCEDRVRVYTDTPYQSLAGDLAVSLVRTDAGQGCRLDLRSPGQLSESLRGLGARALPLVT